MSVSLRASKISLILMSVVINPLYAADEAAELAQQMRNQLGGVLWPTFYEQGPIKALHVCYEEAQKIAAKHSKEGVLIARVSHRNRNSDNAVPEWVSSYYELLKDEFEASGNQNASIDFKTESGHPASLRAISMSNQCLACHGEAIEPELHAKINALYPDDKAIGFQESDMRGAFLIKWMETQ